MNDNMIDEFWQGFKQGFMEAWHNPWCWVSACLAAWTIIGNYHA